ncbi:hypothetical protein PR048_015348 [Dryococelus australis]|uniref:TFIIS central domain-containing protein n=1 Tax=Dryococelus australis TaxID=614101 RepID=A0ABQ9HGT8_9NEOP|nr:hypothetical protein PR048_015348 [Dryococelus australis]
MSSQVKLVPLGRWTAVEICWYVGFCDGELLEKSNFGSQLDLGCTAFVISWFGQRRTSAALIIHSMFLLRPSDPLAHQFWVAETWGFWHVLTFGQGGPPLSVPQLRGPSILRILESLHLVLVTLPGFMVSFLSLSDFCMPGMCRAALIFYALLPWSLGLLAYQEHTGGDRQGSLGLGISEGKAHTVTYLTAYPAILGINSGTHCLALRIVCALSRYIDWRCSLTPSPSAHSCSQEVTVEGAWLVLSAGLAATLPVHTATVVCTFTSSFWHLGPPLLRHAMCCLSLHLADSSGKLAVPHVADVAVASKGAVPAQQVATKGVLPPRRELIFKAASSNEVSVRVYDKVTGKVLTVWSSNGMKGQGKRELPEKTYRPMASFGTIPTCKTLRATLQGIEPSSPRWNWSANAPKLAELKTWLEEHPTYEVVQRSLKLPPPPAASPTKQEVPTSPQEKNPSQKNMAPVGAPTVHRLILPKPKEVDEPPGKQRRDSTQEKQPALVAKRHRRSGSVQNKKQVTDVDKDGVAKQTSGKAPSQTSAKKDQSLSGAAVKTGSPKKVDSKRSTSSEHDKDEEKQKPVPSGPEPIRQNVCRSLQELLLTRAKECSDLEVNEDEIQKIASSIEEEMYTLFRDTGLKYKAKYRSLVFNIKDPKNVTLFRKIVESLVTPFQLVRLTPEELASQELAQWREREAKHQLDMIKKTELDLLNNPKNYVVKTHKGELEIEKEPSVFAGPVAMAEAAVSVDVVSCEGGLGLMEEEVVSAKEEVKHEKKEKHRHKDKKKHKKESKHKDREHKEKGEQHRHRDDQHRHRDGEHERKKSRDEEDRHRHKEKEDNEKKKSKDKEEHSRHKEIDHEKKKSKDREEKQKHNEFEHEKKKIKIEEELNTNKESETDKKNYKEKDYHKPREVDKEKKDIIEEHLPIKECSADQEENSNGYLKVTADKEVKDYQFFINESNADESLENFELKLEESIQAEMKFENDNSTDILDNIPSSIDVHQSFLSVGTPLSVQMEAELGEESALFDRDSNSSHSAGMSQKTKPDAHTTAGVIWSGYINMAGVSNVSTSAKIVYGNGKDLNDVLPSLLEVVGRIDPDTVWDYVSKVKRSGTKEILVLRLTSSGGDAKVSYCTLYKHLHSKNRFGVIGNLPESTRIKDFYIMPLASRSPVPEQLTSLDGQIFEGPRPHILVCIIIRTIARQLVTFPEASHLSKRTMDSSRCVTPSPDPSTPRYPSLQEVDPQFSDDSEGVNSDTSTKQTPKVEAYIPKPVDSSKLTWKQIYPSASSNDSFPELSEDYDDASRAQDEEDIPYSPGEDINETVELNTETKSSIDLQHTVDELDKIIDERREEIKTISTAIGLANTVDVPEMGSLQYKLMWGSVTEFELADTTSEASEIVVPTKEEGGHSTL